MKFLPKKKEEEIFDYSTNICYHIGNTPSNLSLIRSKKMRKKGRKQLFLFCLVCSISHGLFQIPMSGHLCFSAR